MNGLMSKRDDEIIMKRAKTFDAVKMMREIRDRMSEEMKGMTREEQIKYIQRKSQLSGESKKALSAASSFEDSLSAMASDPEIQTELKKIDEEFKTTELDGLEKL
jgi:hypothetical protein